MRNFSINSITTRIIAAIVVCTVLTATSIGIFSSIRSGRLIEEEATSKLSFMVEAYGNSFDQEFSQVEYISNVLEYLITSQINIEKLQEDPEYLYDFKMRLAPMVQELAQKASSAKSAYIYFNPDLTGTEHDLYYIDHNRDGVVSRQEEVSATYYEDPTDESMAWWFAPVQNKRGIWTDPYVWVFDDGSYDVFVSYTKPVFVDNKLIAVVGTDFMFQDIAEIIKNLTVYDTGYGFLLNDNYEFLIHSYLTEGENFSEISNGEYSWIIDKIQQDGSVVIDYTFEGTDVISAFVTMSNGWILGITPPREEVFESLVALRRVTNFLIIIGVILAIIAAFIIGGFITKPLKETFQHIEVISTGDFTQSIPDKITKRKDEIGNIATGIERMQQNIKSLIKNSVDAVTEVDTSSSLLAKTADDTSISAGQISLSVDEIAEGATEQARTTLAASQMLTELNNTFSQLQIGNNEILYTTENAMKENTTSKESLEELKDKNRFNNESISKIEKVIEELSLKSSDIGNIIETISTIADQTNLLSLNASIEAARAGEAGKGFVVVANEIRKLAEESAKSTDKIRNIVTAIQAESTKTAEIMMEVKSSSIEQTNSVEQVNISFTNTSKSIDNISFEIKNINKLIGEVISSKDNITQCIENISAISQQTAAATEEVSATTQQQTIAIEEVAKLAENLNGLSKKLTNEINQFKI
ncbi:methyl-accepting chemotaxis protein [Alkaliphilus peptidifermentans]|nr:methyl-accepting chemotaxis protein [Alkaliphilus peptidifermentans]